MANAPRDGNNVPALLITSNGTAVPLLEMLLVDSW
jgi:hypothetical protein